MPTGVYKRTDEARRNISLSLIGSKRHLGCKHSEETRQLMRAHHKGMSGQRQSDKTRNKIGIANLGVNNGMFGRYGDSNPNWNGGAANYPYNFLKIRHLIRARDGSHCKICGIPQPSLPRALDVHHINYDEKDYNVVNLISLCRKCHAKIQGDREYWQFYFRKKEGESGG